MEHIVAEIKSSIPGAAKLRISVHKVDVGIPKDITSMFEEIQEHHHTHIEILVSNAGYSTNIHKVKASH
jgi:3-oxoacyl-[acyl-carrier protein] reductase